MVRRAAAAQLSDFARALGEPNTATAAAATAAAAGGATAAAEAPTGGGGNVAEELLPLYRALLADEQVVSPLPPPCMHAHYARAARRGS